MEVTVFDSDSQATLLKSTVAQEIADAFLKTLWGDAVKDKVGFQTVEQPVLKKRALEVHGRHYKPLLAFHWGLTGRVAAAVQMDLLPSFAWFRMYFKGDICRVHADRSACEVSLSMLLGSSDGLPWPLQIGAHPVENCKEISDSFGPEPFKAFELTPGDAVVYLGSRRRHGRTSPNPNRWSAHLFLQWVKRDGPHADLAFEGLTLDNASDF